MAEHGCGRPTGFEVGVDDDKDDDDTQRRGRIEEEAEAEEEEEPDEEEDDDYAKCILDRERHQATDIEVW